MDQLADQISQSLNIVQEQNNDKQGVDVNEGLKEFAKWIEAGKVKNILVLCGAGVSVSAGTCSL